MPTSIHGLFWLAKTEIGIIPVDASNGEGVIEAVSDLPDVRMEFHWLASKQAADGFRIGVERVGRNAVSAIQGIGGVDGGVLLGYSD
jgi:hypothetical protein